MGPEREGRRGEYEEAISEIRHIFNADDYEEFLGLPERLNRLLGRYEERIGSVDGKLPLTVLEAIVTSEYLDAQEVGYHELSEQGGLYLPANEGGGGDFWLEGNGMAGVGGTGKESASGSRAQLLDMAGHGRDAAITKAFTMRLIELYHTAHPSGSGDTGHLFLVLDQFLSRCPFLYNMAEYAEAQVQRNEGAPPKLEVMKAGGSSVFIRDRATGELSFVTNGNGILGFGFSAEEQLVVNEIPVNGSLDVFLSSDGLLDIRIDPKDGEELFSDVFQKFANERRHLSGEEFKKELFDYVHAAKAEGRVDDDITIFVLPVEK